jgi:hypothetical protein
MSGNKGGSAIAGGSPAIGCRACSVHGNPRTGLIWLIDAIGSADERSRITGGLSRADTAHPL